MGLDSCCVHRAERLCVKLLLPVLRFCVLCVELYWGKRESAAGLGRGKYGLAGRVAVKEGAGPKAL